jgi:hypothetical protein
VKVHKECIDKIMSFTSKNLRRDRVVLIPSEVKVYHRVMQGVCRPG